MKHYVHQVPGRLRVRLPVLRRNPGQCEDVESLLDGLGVRRVEIRPLTGSVIVHYDAETVSSERILRSLAECGYYDESQSVDGDEALRRAAARAGHRIRKAAFGWVVGRALEANGLSLLAAFI